jgi:hypothetical protein
VCTIIVVTQITVLPILKKIRHLHNEKNSNSFGFASSGYFYFLKAGDVCKINTLTTSSFLSFLTITSSMNLDKYKFMQVEIIKVKAVQNGFFLPITKLS